MKKLCFLIAVVTFSSVIYAQTSGTLTVTTTTSEVGGNYKPKNILAIWIEDSSNNFVKTLLAYADKRKQYLTAWKTVTTNAGSPYNTVDAITGATRPSHTTRTCSWNGTNVISGLVSDGTYTIKMEITDQNGTGRSGSFSFTKGPEAQTIAPANIPSFSDITINWQPATSATSNDLSDIVSIYPNPSSLKAIVSGTDIFSVELMNLKGKIVLLTSSNTIDMSNLPESIYIAKIETKKGTVLKKVVKE